MDEVFRSHVASLRPSLDSLLRVTPVAPGDLPRSMPRAGVYLLSEGGRHLYVGRSNDIRGRIGRHCKRGATHRMAAFAFRLAREASGKTRASYKAGENSRAGLMENPRFVAAFDAAKQRIRSMELRYIEEPDPVRQCLLEIYVAVTLATPYNDFDNH